MARNAYDGMTDIEVFNKARDSLLRVQKLPAGSADRDLYQEVFDSAMLELGWRGIRYALAERESVK